MGMKLFRCNWFVTSELGHSDIPAILFRRCSVQSETSEWSLSSTSEHRVLMWVETCSCYLKYLSVHIRYLRGNHDSWGVSRQLGIADSECCFQPSENMVFLLDHSKIWMCMVSPCILFELASMLLFSQQTTFGACLYSAPPPLLSKGKFWYLLFVRDILVLCEEGERERCLWVLEWFSLGWTV